jgi:Carboxypeptidase regulatory-like domain
MLTRRTLLVVFCSLVFLFPICPLLYGQATGSFSGTITDKTGSVVSGAAVKATAQGTGVSRESKTDDSGHYLMNLLPIGDYTIRVDFQGFQPAEQKDIKLQVDEHRDVNFILSPASVSSTVEVSATEVAIQTENPTLGQVITSKQVAELPLNGRDFVQLATLTPGTTQETNPSSFFNGGPSSEVSARGTYSLSVGGSRAQSTDWLFDGIDNNELTAGGIAILPSIDAIQEFKVLTFNYSAEYGTRAGPTVLVTTKSGSNQFHGSLFEFFRNTVLDARSYFASSREQFNLNQFGGSLGGPIRKDKTFFFLDYQAKMQRHGIPFVGLVPTAAMMNGDYTLDPFGRPNSLQLTNPYSGTPFQCDASGNPIPAGAGGTQATGTNCNKIPTNMFDSTGKAMIDLYPAANANNAALGYNYTNVPVRKLNEGEFDVRLDHNFSAKDSIFARFSYDQATSFVPGGSPGFAEESPFASTQDITNHGRNVALSETHIFSGNSVNQVSFGFNRIFNYIKSFGDSTCESAALGIQGANINSKCPDAPAGVVTQSTKACVSCGLSSTQMFGGYWSLGDRGFAPFQGGTNVYYIADSFDMNRGKHDIRIGGEIRLNQMNVLSNAFQDGYFLMFGSYTGDATADLLLGQVGGAIHDQTFDGATTGRRWKMFRPYVQDDWRATPNLTLNLGLAWALVTPITEAQNRQSNFDFDKTCSPSPGCNYLIPGVNSNGRVGVQFDWTALEPRIGMAWRPGGSANTAIRAGYAIFHDSSWNQGAQGLWENPPFFAETDNFSGLCPFGNTTQDCGLSRSFLPAFTSPPNPANFTGTIQSQNLNFKQGMVQQYNFNVERQLPGDIVLTVGYAGSHSTHILVGQVNENVGSPSACGVVPGYTLGCGPGGTAFAAPYGPFTTIDSNNDVGSASYNSLQVKAETKSAHHGLYALIGYTYAKTLDSGLPDGLGTNPGATYWPLPGSNGTDWGLSQIDLGQNFTASVIYNLPFGKGQTYGGNWNGFANAVLGGWQTNVIVKATSGFPLFVVDNVNQSGVNFQWNGDTLNRPNEVGNPMKAGPVAANPTCVAPAQVHTLTNWFNPCAFMAASVGELGDASRAPLYGPDFVNVDFSVIKNFPFTFHEGMNLQFRAEFFNLFNHAQFFLPGLSGSGMQDISSPSSFGVTSATVNNPRVIQFALKLTF